MLYSGIGGPKDFALWDLARRATLGFVLYQGYAINGYTTVLCCSVGNTVGCYGIPEGGGAEGPMYATV